MNYDNLETAAQVLEDEGADDMANAIHNAITTLREWDAASDVIHALIDSLPNPPPRAGNIADRVRAALERTPSTQAVRDALCGRLARSHLAALDRIAELEKELDRLQTLWDDVTAARAEEAILRPDPAPLGLEAALDEVVRAAGAIKACIDAGYVVREDSGHRVGEAMTSTIQARLTRLLAVERGDESAAPEGWRVGPSGWAVYGAMSGNVVKIVSREDVGEWAWEVYADNNDDRPLATGEERTALEAMEAADAAAKETPDV